MDRRAIARALGRRGGQVRAARLTAAERKRVAALGGTARRRSLETARRIADNFTYAAAVRDLGAPPPHVVRVKTCTGPLPGIYLDTPGRRRR